MTLRPPPQITHASACHVVLRLTDKVTIVEEQQWQECKKRPTVNTNLIQITVDFAYIKHIHQYNYVYYKYYHHISLVTHGYDAIRCMELPFFLWEKGFKVIFPYQHHAQETVYLKQPSRNRTPNDHSAIVPTPTDPNLPGFFAGYLIISHDV